MFQLLTSTLRVSIVTKKNIFQLLTSTVHVSIVNKYNTCFNC